MTRWIRFSRADGSEGFGTLSADGRRVTPFQGSLFEHTEPMKPTERSVPSVPSEPSEPTGSDIDAGEITLLPPCRPGKVVALWNNFHALSKKLDKAPPKHPLFLIKPARSVIATGEVIRRPGSYDGKIAYEGELGIVIGRRCASASVEEAEAAIFGYTCVNDVTAAELLQEDPNFPQWCRAKGFDTFCCLGPAIATGFDWRAARVITTLEGVERQNYPLDDMIFTPAEQVSLISHDMTLEPGDVIACGTSLGIGSIKDGAEVEVSIEGIGRLVNRLL